MASKIQNNVKTIFFSNSWACPLRKTTGKFMKNRISFFFHTLGQLYKKKNSDPLYISTPRIYIYIYIYIYICIYIYIYICKYIYVYVYIYIYMYIYIYTYIYINIYIYMCVCVCVIIYMKERLDSL